MNSLLLLALLAFAPVRGPREWSFPRDHGSHGAFQTEWWYYTGHLETEAGATFGYELVFFRFQPEAPDVPADFAGWKPLMFHPAHFAITDESKGTFFHEQRVRRDLGGLAGADSTTLHAWCGDWSVTLGSDGVHHLKAAAGAWALDLEMEALKPPVLNGPGGVSRKGPGNEQASYYYSLSRLKTRGTIASGNRPQNITGISWMDHEFFSSPLDSSLSGWDWFSVQLDDGTELMLYRLRGRDGSSADRLSGTFVDTDGRPRYLSRSDFTISSSETWKSPATGIVYPAAWAISVPSISLTLNLEPTVPDQELDTRNSTRVIYWEGSVTATGSRNGLTTRGRGYVELTGYDGQVPMGSN